MATEEEKAKWRETDRIVPIPDHEPAPHLWPKPEEQFVCPLSGTTKCTASPKQQRKCPAC